MAGGSRSSLRAFARSALGVSAGLVVSLSIGLGWIVFVALGTAFGMILNLGPSDITPVVMSFIVVLPTVLLASPAFMIASKIGGRRAGVVAAVAFLAIMVSVMVLFAVGIALASWY